MPFVLNVETHLEEAEFGGTIKEIFAENERYVGKLLVVNAGEALSLQYHEYKDETLRVLEERKLERVGSTSTIDVDVRVISATNANLGEAVSKGEFREDLLYRLRVVPIIIPALRDRTDEERARALIDEVGDAVHALSHVTGGGIAGTWAGGYMADRFGAGKRGNYVIIPALAFLATIPLYMLAILSPDLTTTFFALLIPTGLGLAWLGPVLSAIQHVVPPTMRATASAIFLFINNLIGIGAGTVAAKKYGAAEMVDPRPYLVGKLQETFEIYPEIGTLLPAMGYGNRQLADLELLRCNGLTIDTKSCRIVILNLDAIDKYTAEAGYRAQDAHWLFARATDATF